MAIFTNILELSLSFCPDYNYPCTKEKSSFKFTTFEFKVNLCYNKMQKICQKHQTELKFVCSEKCQSLCVICEGCVSIVHPIETKHSEISKFFFNDVRTHTKKNKLKILVDNYFESKRVQYQTQIQKQKHQVLTYIDNFVTEQDDQLLLQKINAVYQSGIQNVLCQQLFDIYNKAQLILLSRHYDQQNEEERTKLFQKFEQFNIEYKFNSYVGVKDIKKRIEGYLKKKSKEVKLKKIYFIDSKILLKNEDIDFVINLFNKKVNNTYLLFRASENEFSSQNFHYKCDKKSNTLTVLKNQFGKILGGYTESLWQSNLGYVYDAGRSTFIFSVNLREKMTLNGKYGIWNSTSFGPVFGYGNYGHDLCISNKANTSKSSYAEFPLSFNNEKQYASNQSTWELFSGQSKGNNFLVSQWQVWRIQFEQ